jgi:hypothetical protein
MKAAAKVIRIDEIPAGKRAAAGKRLFEVKPNDLVKLVMSRQDFLDQHGMEKSTIKKKSVKKQ